MLKFKTCITVYVAMNILFIHSLYPMDLILVKDQETENLIKDILNPILQIANVPNDSIKIYLINNDTPNAFVFAGQNIFLHTGLLTTADSIDEIAGVLAHELGHITAGHLSRGDILYSKANIFILLGLAAFLLTAPFLGTAGGLDIIGFLTYGVTQVGATSALSYSRGEENQADELALEYISKSIYSVNGFYQFMSKIAKFENEIIYTEEMYSWYSTHPLTRNRMAFIENYAKSLPKQNINNKIIVLNDRLKRVQAKIYSYKLSYKDFNNLYKNKNTPDALYGRMIAEYKEHNYEKALQYAEILKKSYVNDIYLSDLIGDIYFTNNNFSQAITYYQLALNNLQDDGITEFKLAKSYYSINNMDKALQYVNISIQINANNPASWHLKSVIMSKLNKDNLADLATAHRYVILGNKVKAKFFATKAFDNLPPQTKEWYEASDLLKDLK